MEPQKYYEFDSTYNNYSVHFANKQGLSVDRIKDIFSEFGNVLNVGKAGDDYGFRFVKFREESEVNCCVEGLKNHRSIRLLPKRLKQQNNDHSNLQQRRNNLMTNNQQLQQPWGQNNTENNGEFNNHQNNENHRSNEVSPAKSQLSLEPQILVTNEAKNSSIKTKIEKPEEIIKRKKESRSLTDDPQIGWKKISSPGNIDDNFQPVAATLKKVVGHIESEPTLNEPDVAEKSLLSFPSNPIIINEAPELPVSPSSKSEITFSSNLAVPAIPVHVIPEEIPLLVGTDSVPQKKNQAEEITNGATPLMPKIIDTVEIHVAEEIYVANVPTDHGVNHICRLFEKLEPIWVGPIKYVQSTSIRFCVVSFRSAEQANACEAQFDGHELGGKILIILRPQTLQDIAAS